MEKAALKAIDRSENGAKNVKQVRKEGFTPVILYGKEYDNASLKIKTTELNKFLSHHGLGAMTEIEANGKVELALVKEIQRNPVTHEVLHVDFLHLKAGVKVKVDLPLAFVNEDKVPNGLFVQRLLEVVNVESLPKNLVDFIEVDLEGLELGDTLAVKDIDMSKNEGMEILDDPDTPVLHVVEPTVYKEPTEEEAEEGEESAADVPVVGETEETEE